MSEPFAPADSANSPQGTAIGIFPGRVTWAFDPSATNWDESWDEREDIHYWDDDHTSQTVVDEMVGNTVLWLTDEDEMEDAWQALFEDFNSKRGKGAVGYISGESVVLKPNHVDQREHDDVDQNADSSPQVLLALLKQLVNEAGVRQQDIIVCDASRYIANKTFDRCHAQFPDVIYADTNYYDSSQTPGAANGRVMVTSSSLPLIHYSGVNVDGEPIPPDHLPQPFVDADYVINFAIMKGHSSAGVTLTAKNWYGNFCRSPFGAHHDTLPGFSLEVDATPRLYGQYRPLVDLIGHEHLGGKTMLYVLDGLWGFPYHGTGSRPLKWQNAPFNNNYPSSILMSQDPVALDSVALDFLRTEFAENMGGKGRLGDAAVDDYLHEAAQADSAPSGVVYDPENDGSPLGSLGVHEHWNNAIDKQYSRNLGTGDGIELIDSMPKKVQEIEIQGGVLDWFSCNVELTTTTAAELFAPLSQLIIVQGQNGEVYIPPDVVFPRHPGTDTISPFDVDQAYQMYLLGASSLVLPTTGTAWCKPTSITLTLAPHLLHWLPCPYREATPIADVFTSATLPELVIIQSQSGGVYVPPDIVFLGHPGSNTIGNMLPGEGYKLFHSKESAVSFGYPAANTSSTMSPIVKTAPVHFTPVAPTNLSQPVFITTATLNGLALEAGDELGIFDGEQCVGALVLDAMPTKNPLIVYLAYELPVGQALSGARKGQPMKFMVWDADQDTETAMHVDLAGPGAEIPLFLEAGVVAVSLNYSPEVTAVRTPWQFYR